MWNPNDLENHDPETNAGGAQLEPLERADALLEDARLLLAIAIPSLDRAITKEPDRIIETVEGNIILLRETLGKLGKARALLVD